MTKRFWSSKRHERGKEAFKEYRSIFVPDKIDRRTSMYATDRARKCNEVIDQKIESETV